MRANFRHYTLFIISLIAFIATVLGYGYLHSKIFAQAMQAGDLAQKVSELEEKKKFEYGVDVYSKFATEKSTLGFIVSKEKIIEFIEKVEKIGSETSTDLELNGIDSPEITKTVDATANFSHMKAHIEIKGTWANVMKALALLEQLPYSVSYDNLNLTVEDLPKTAADTSTTTKKAAPEARIWKLTTDVKSLIVP